MTVQEIKNLIQTKSYDFLRNDKHLGNRILFLTLGGSYAYGTNIEGSDVDIRGCTLNSKEEILTNQNFEQFVNNETDTTIYSFNKLVSLLCNVNPNTIEMVGCKPEHYFYIHPIGQELLDNADLFLSKKCIHSFGGYAGQQLRRLSNISNRYMGQTEHEQYVLSSIENARYDFKNQFFPVTDDQIKLYIDKADQEEYDTEIFMDISLKHYPLRDYCSMWNSMKSIVSSYNKLGKRNTHAKEHGKISKHMMHLVRLYLMCLDILEKGQIITYREADHDFLMSIRNGDFIDENEQPIPEFYEMVDEYENRLDYAKNNTSLPDKPDYKKINEFVMSVNERVVKGEI